MKTRTVSTCLAISLCALGHGQLIQTTDPGLHYVLDPMFMANPALPFAAFTFSTVESKDFSKDGPPPIQVEGSLLFYRDGTTLLNILPTSTSVDPEFTGRITQVSMFRPIGDDNGNLAPLAGNNFELFLDGDPFAASGWNLASPPGGGGQLRPPGMRRSNRDSDYLGFWNGNQNDSNYPANTQVMTFLFWLDFDFSSATMASLIELSYGNTPEGQADLIFKWQGLQPKEVFGGEDSYTAIARMQPFFGDVVPVPEPSTYAAGGLLLLFAAGHFLVRRRQRLATAKADR